MCRIEPYGDPFCLAYRIALYPVSCVLSYLTLCCVVLSCGVSLAVCLCVCVCASRVAQLLTLNVDSTTWMTRLVLAGMVERKKGAIVNIGSG